MFKTCNAFLCVYRHSVGFLRFNLENNVKTKSKVQPIIGNSDFTKKTCEIINSVSQNNASVLLLGERGTGKRLIAQHLHFAVSQDKNDFYEINCKSFNSSDIQMMFNGFTRFIQTGKKITIFVNYINDLSLDLQKVIVNSVKVLREHGVNFKLVCASEKNLEDLVEVGSFLQELYFQISTITINVLPLRQRKDDILPIAEFYLNKFSKLSGYKFEYFSDNAKEELLKQFWKGNIDELINSVQRAFIVGDEPAIKISDLGLIVDHNVVTNSLENDLTDKTLKNAIDTFKREYLIKILKENDWNQTKTARILGIQRTYVIRLMNELNIR